MKRSLVLLIVVLLVSALAISACGKKAATEGESETTPVAKSAEAPQVSGSQDEESEPVEAPEAVEEPTSEPEPTASQEDELDVSDREAGLDKFDSYKTTWVMSWETVEDGKPKTGKWGWTEERVKDPRAARLIWSTESSDEEASSMESVEVGGTSYAVMEASDGTRTCIASATDQDSSTSSMFTPGMLGSIEGAKLVGRESVNGMPARHYRYDDKAAALAGFGKIQGDIWVAADDDTVLKEITTWEGGAGLFGGLTGGTEGKGSWTWEVTEVNQPIDIQPPPECSTESSLLPILPDAKDKIQAGDAVMYQSATPLDKVVEFYRTEMAAAGWQEQKEGGMEVADMAMLSFTKDDMTAQLIASSQDNQTGVSISISK